MPLHNTRADDMWREIYKYVDFHDKSVMDVGCGYGDMLARAYEAGAKIVFGMDNDKRVIYEAGLRLGEAGYSDAPIYLLRANANSWNVSWPGFHNIIFCFSVLPYLEEPTEMLRHFKRDSNVALIECQYAGDGPGFPDIKGDDDMYEVLMGGSFVKGLKKWEGFYSADKIGETKVEIRDTYRSIWLCQ